MKALIVAAALALAGSVAAQEGPGAPGVMLRGLDKFSGVTTIFTAPVGAAVSYERLIVRVQGCRPRGEGGAAAYIEIWDSRTPEDRIFAGWMFAEMPAVAALDHPRYDIWVDACSTSSGDAS